MPVSPYQVNPLTKRHLRLFAVGCGALTAAIGAVHLVGWWSGFLTFRGLHTITMKTNSAFCLVLCGAALILVALRDGGRLSRAATGAVGGLVLLIGSLTLYEHVSGLDLGIDQLLAREPEGAVGATAPNRMGPPGALSLVLGGAALILLAGRWKMGPLLAQWLGLFLSLIHLLGLLGHLYAVKGLYGAARYTAIAWPTTAALLVLAMGILCARPEAGWVPRAISPDPGGAAIRRLLPAAFLLPIVLGWLSLQGEYHGLYQGYFGTSILVLSWIVIFSFMVYNTGSWISRSARATRESEERFRVAQELSPDGFTILRPVRNEQGRVYDFVWIYENPAVARMNGTDPEVVVGRRLSELFPSHASTPFHEVYIRVAETGEPGVIEASYNGGRMRKEIWFRVAVVPIGKDIAVLAQDITERKRAEETIVAGRAKLEAALASMTDAVFIVDAGGNFVDFNDSFATFHRFGSKEECAATLTEKPDLLQVFFGNGDPAPAGQLPVPRALKGETVSGAEYRLRRADTGESWVGSYSFGPIRNKDGAITGAVIAARDVTRQKEAEEKLRYSEEKFSKAFAYNSAAMVISRLENGRYLEVNETWLALFGYRREEVVGRTPFELSTWVNPEDRARAVAQLRAKGSVRNLELTLRKSNGEILVVLTSAEILTLADDMVILWSTVDITDRKRAEEALKEREEQLHLFIEHAPAALAMFDHEMRYLNASRRWSDLHGVVGVELRGLSHYQVFPEVSPEWKESYRRGLAGEIQRAEADRMERADGSVQWIRWEVRPWHDGAGNVGGIVIFAEDMTAVKEAENERERLIAELKRSEESLRHAKDGLEIRVQERTQELERTYDELRRETEERIAAIETLRKNERLLLQQSRLAAMGEMLGNIAHQWRQPLNSLGLILQDLVPSFRLGELDEEYLGNSVTKGMQLILHMSHTIDDFRNYLQPEKEKRKFNVNDAVATTISLFEATLRTMEVDLQVKEGEQLVIDGHRNEFCQVIMNLITNARDVFKERETPSPKLVIELFRQDGKTVITVTDNGGGIPEEILDKVFDPYFTTKGPDRGTGIGLFMSKSIIEKSMGGSLMVRNTGEGAEFRIEI